MSFNILTGIRFWTFTAVLGVGLVAAVSLTAQDKSADPSERRFTRELLSLDGRGSQLGVMVRDLEAEASLTAGGVEIAQVNPDSAAEKAGVRAGDIVVEFDGERVRSARQFTRLVQESPDGRQLAMVVVRDGSRQTLQVTPEARSLSWTLDIDGDRIRRDLERGLRDFRMDVPNFNFDDRGGLTTFRSRGRLGVTVESMSDQLAGYFGATSGGALVSSVTTGSPAEKAGLRAGDVITTIDGDPVRSAGDVSSELAAVQGTEVTVGILRDKRPSTLKVTIEPQPDARERRPGTPRRPVRPAAFARPV